MVMLKLSNCHGGDSNGSWLRDLGLDKYIAKDDAGVAKVKYKGNGVPEMNRVTDGPG